MILRDIISALEVIAPTSLAEPWDNVGLLVGDPEQQISRILLTIDYSPPVVREARERECDLVIVYHAPVFVRSIESWWAARYPMRFAGAWELVAAHGA